MRVAVLSDIHANRHALEAVREAIERSAPDHVIVAGDVINRGPEPRACLELILAMQRECGWRVLKGNHEDFVLFEAIDRDPGADWRRKLYAHTRWTMQRVQDELHDIASWPDQHALLGPDGSEIRVVHASMRSNRHGLYAHMAGPELAELTAPAPAVLVARHTHIPFIRREKETLIVNAGAVGMPFDGIKRASFALLDWSSAAGWQPHIVRLDYDIDAAERAFFDTGYWDDAGAMVPLILDELRNAKSRIGLWHHFYEASVATGELTIEDSVVQLLEKLKANPLLTFP